MIKAMDWTVHLLPENKPRYLMGVGTPRQIYEGVKRGIRFITALTGIPYRMILGRKRCVIILFD